MAIPEKRMLGTWGLWLGILIFAQLGFLLVPKSKLLRASQALLLTINSKLPFDEYRSLVGLLEHIRQALCLPRRVMHGLYQPHGPHGEGVHGPCTLVRPNFFMAGQLAQWLEFLDVRATTSHSESEARVFLDCLRQCASLRRLDARDSGWVTDTSLHQILAENDELTVIRRD